MIAFGEHSSRELTYMFILSLHHHHPLHYHYHYHYCYYHHHYHHYHYHLFLISMISVWLSFLTYPNLFGIKGLVVGCGLLLYHLSHWDLESWTQKIQYYFY
jgi:hypothetical protein